jgi:hypothetical protein
MNRDRDGEVGSDHLVSGYLFFLSGAYLGYVLLVGGDDISAFPSSRFLVPILPIIIAASYAAIEASVRGRLVAWTVTAFAARLFVMSATDLIALVKASNPGRVAGTAGPMSILRTSMTPDPSLYRESALSTWVRNQASAEERVAIAVPWAGSISYYSGAVVIDTLGLNDLHIAHFGQRLQQGADTKMDPNYVLERRPDLVFVNVQRGYASGDLTFEQAGGFKVGDRQMVELLKASPEYILRTDAPTDIVVFSRLH